MTDENKQESGDQPGATPNAPAAEAPPGTDSSAVGADAPSAGGSSLPPAGDPPPAPAAGDSPKPGDKPADPPPPAGPWGDNWREAASAEDQAVLKALQRYASPKDVAKALVEAQAKIRSGELSKPLPDDATPEQIAEYRKARGIPEQAAGYLEKLPDGLVIGEDDKPLFDSFAGELHKHNVDPKVAHGLIAWYQNLVSGEDKARVDADAELKATVEHELRTEWGQEFKINVNVVNSFLAQAPKEVQEMLAEARTMDGTPIKGTAAFARWIASVAREINPAITIPGASGGDPLQSIDGRIAELDKMMRTDRKGWNNSPALQAEYLRLVDQRDSLRRRTG